MTFKDASQRLKAVTILQTSAFFWTYLPNLRWQHIVKWVNKHLERDHVLKSVEALQ